MGSYLGCGQQSFGKWERSQRQRIDLGIISLLLVSMPGIQL